MPSRMRAKSMERKVSRQILGFSLSLMLHAGVATLLLLMSHPIRIEQKPIVVDFNAGGFPLRQAQGEPESAITKQVGGARSELSRRNEPVFARQAETEQSPVLIAKTTEQIREELPIEEKRAETTEEGALSTDDRQAESAPPYEKMDGGGPGKEDNPGSVFPGSSLSSTESAKDIYLKDHFGYIRDTIMKNLSYPSSARRMGWEGKVLVSFIINNDGFVSDIKIVESSGFGVLDRNAVETVKKSSPFPKPPVRAVLIMPVVYKLR